MVRQPDILDRLGALLDRLAPYLIFALLLTAAVGVASAQDMMRVVRGGWRREAAAPVTPSEYWYTNADQIAFWGFQTTNAFGFVDEVAGLTATSKPNVATGPTWFDIYGTNKGVILDGGNDYFATGLLPVSLNFARTNSLTVMGWLNPTALVNVATWVSKAYSGDTRFYCPVLDVENPDKWAGMFYQASTTNSGRLMSISAVAFSNWTHVAIVISNGSTVGWAGIYVNGIYENKIEMPSYNTLDGPLALGSLVGSGTFWKGYLDEIRVITNWVPSNHVWEVYYNTKARFGL
jgi:hypothetical protein